MRPCNQCGKCCLKYSNGSGLRSASLEDVSTWMKYAPEVLEYAPAPLFDLWISPVTGEEMLRCPWLRKLPRKNKYKCRIHEVKPDVCFNYPVDIEQMIGDGCEMLEPGDLDKPESELLKELKRIKDNQGL